MSFSSILRSRADERPDGEAFTFLLDGDLTEVTVSYGELDRRARNIAALLQERGGRGQRVVLLYPPGPDYVAAFFGCLYAGAIAVPAYPPLEERQMPRLLAIVADCDPAVVLTVSAFRGLAQGSLASLTWLETDGYGEAEPSLVAAGPEDVAFLQYTSGSTGTPKGVMVTHGNLLHNSAMIKERFEHTGESRGVIWLPPYHDMGLIGGILQPIYAGFPVTLMSPLDLLRRPYLWLKAVSRFGGTTSGGPNFAYDLCARKVTEEERAGLDLSSWRVAFDGAEPVRTETIDRFCAAFEGSGFRREAFYPCYGLAEATLIVTGGRVSDVAVTASHEGRTHVSCGTSAGDQSVVVDAADGEVGEICVRGPSVAAGYWGNPAESAAVFGGGYLRTGDLGFLRDGELFVTGRIKDVLIVRGVNHYPDDIERTAAEAHPALRPGCGAAFQSGDRLVLAFELDPRADADPAQITRAVRQAVFAAHGLHLDEVVLLAKGAIPKTSSGKVRRSACRDTYESSAAGGALLRIAREVLESDDVTPDEPLSSFGLDSLRAMEFCARAEREVGVVDIADLLSGCSVDDLAGRVKPVTTADQPLDGETRLTEGEQAMWFLHHLAPASAAAYRITVAADVTGDLDVEALSRAFDTLAARHPGLRTRFPLVDGEPVRVVDQRFHLTVHEPVPLDCRSLGDPDPYDVSVPFDLQNGPLWRADLHVRGPGRAVLVISAHHIVSDLSSLGLLFAELRSLYEGDGAALPEPGDPRASVRRERALLSGSGPLVEFWRDRLDEAPAALELPADLPRPPVQTYRGATRTVTLGQPVLDAVRRAGSGATQHATLLAAYAWLLHRFTGQDDLVIGTPSAARTHHDVSRLVGYRVNPLPIRVGVSSREPFAAFAGKVQEAMAAALAHQDLPFPVLVQELAPPRDASRTPVFQVFFASQDLPSAGALGPFSLGAGSLRLGSAVLTPRAGEPATAQMDLMLEVASGADGLTCRFTYNADLFTPAVIDRMVAAWRTLLTSVDAWMRPLDLDLVGDRAAGAPVVAVDLTKPLHTLVEEQADRTPAALAVGTLTYAELDRRANRVAAALREAGVGVEDRVGIRMQRGVSMIVTMLGVLKAGAAYVPLDPGLPEARLAYMVEQAGAKVVLTGEPEHACDERVPVQVTGANLAYVMYTSGSTGEPKGVAVPHSGVVNLLAAFDHVEPLEPGARCGWWTSFAFDVSVHEIFSALCSGGSVHVVPEEVRPDPRGLLGWLAEQAIEVVYVPPFLLADLAGLLAAGAPAPPLRRLVSAVEPIREQVVATLLEHLPGARFVNGYGPTEATVYGTAHWTGRSGLGDGNLPIGTALANVPAYILDADLRPVPPGVTGEIYLGGAGVTRGYHGKPGLTAERYLPDPFVPGGRVYATGDRARHRADGAIEFLGRSDQQLKVRGHRVEPGEVEQLLVRHPAVHEALVLPRPGPDGSTLLVGYVRLLSAADLVSYLREHLPGYLVPSALVEVGEWPVTRNGKLDRRALPDPDWGSGTFTAPRTEAERAVADVWRALLGVPRVGVDQDFFAMGGHSLLAARAVTELRERLHADLPITAVFEHPTVERLARAIGARPQLPPITALPRRRVMAP
ncbi:amino acid adenylation domain-containing protein [Nonomuraea sp. NPDC050556]|uniref:amino acid adenylation domain-containing protein n=1 Tax=Nonomuraea sp. NPDC050556 TaxID=3364369 RepID=UPI0037A6570B